jgi:CRP-like cAMP-binding protein
MTLLNRELENLLLDNPLFHGVKPETQTEILKEGVSKSYPEDHFLINHEDDSTSLLFILSGKVSIERLVNEKVLSFIHRGAGEIIGELACITNSPRSADVRTVVPTTIFKVSSKVVHRLFQSDPQFSLNMMLLLASKLRESVDTTSKTSLKLNQKLAIELYNEFKSDRVKVGKGVWELTRKVTQNEWANRVGTSRESVNRTLKQFQDEGVISVVNGKIRLLDKEALNDIIQGL